MTRREFEREYHKDSKENRDLEWLVDTILPRTEEAVAHSARVVKTAYTDHLLVPELSGTKVHELVDVLRGVGKTGVRKITRRHG